MSHCFPEVRQNWLGFSISGNSGSGLGIDFARELHANLNRIFSDFGDEKITEGSHLEKVCLITEGVGRDNISDFTTNLIKDFLCRYTETFAKQFLSQSQVKVVSVNNVRFNYETEAWERSSYTLPWANSDYIILTPKDMLTRDENWINRHDLIEDFEQIPAAIPDLQLRTQISNYFYNVLARPKDREPNKRERIEAVCTIMKTFPLDCVIITSSLKSNKEITAVEVSSDKVFLTEVIFHKPRGNFKTYLEISYIFARMALMARACALGYLKLDVIEIQRRTPVFCYHDGMPIEREKDLQILYRLVLVWYRPSDRGNRSERRLGRSISNYQEGSRRIKPSLR